MAKSRYSYHFAGSAAALAIAVAAVLVPSVASAQDHAQANAADTGEIVVTAEKTNSTANKTALAIDVFSNSTLVSDGVTNVSGLAEYTPGLEVFWNSRGPQINVRGVAQTDATSKGESDVIFNIDGIYQARPQQFGASFFDLDRVEVLKGPQGTLYGISATGGVVNVVTARPTHELAAGATVELGSYDAKRLQAYFNVPITNDLAVRLAVNENKVNGFIYPVLGDTGGVHTSPAEGGEDNWAARLTTKYDFGHNGTWVLTGTIGHIGGPAPSNQIICGDTVGDTPGIHSCSNIYSSGSNKFAVYDSPLGGTAGLDDKYVNINTTLDFDIGNIAHVSYVGAHYWWHGHDTAINTNNTPGSSYNYGDYENHETTDQHELRISNADAHAKLEWLLGASYWRDYNNENDIEWQLQDTPQPIYFNGVLQSTSNCPQNFALPGCANPNPQIVGPNTHSSKGVFGQLSYHATNSIKLTAGLRYSWDYSARSALFSAGPIFGADAYTNSPPGTGGPIGDWLNSAGKPCYLSYTSDGWCVNSMQSFNDAGANSSKALTYKVGIDYTPSPNTLIYASVRTGYKGGGFNDFDPAAFAATGKVQTGLYGDERITAYELGYKGRLAPNLHVNSQLYYYDFNRYQNTGAVLLPASASGVVIYTTVVPVSMYGWETELNWKPTPVDAFSATLTLEKAHYDSGANQLQAGFLSFAQTPWGGHSLSGVPTVATTLAYDHRFVLAEGGAIKFHVSSKISGRYFVENIGANTPNEYRQPFYTRTDATLGYTTGNGKLTVEAFVKNLENQLQLLSVPQGGNVPEASITQPRTEGIRLTVKY